jgi:hypothetical protein
MELNAVALLIYVNRVAVRSMCTATMLGRTSAKNTLQGSATGDRIEPLVALFVGGTDGKPVLAKRSLSLS